MAPVAGSTTMIWPPVRSAIHSSPLRYTTPLVPLGGVWSIGGLVGRLQAAPAATSASSRPGPSTRRHIGGRERSGRRIAPIMVGLLPPEDRPAVHRDSVCG